MDKIKKLIEEVNKFGQLCKSNHLDSHSAAAAFFMFVSIVPFIILFLAIIPFTPVTDTQLIEIAEIVLPDKLDLFAVDVIGQLRDRSITAIWLSAAVALWSASRSLVTIKQGLNEIRGVVDFKNFVFLRFVGIFYTLILIFSFLLMLILNVVITGIERYLKDAIGITISEQYVIVNILFILRPLITILVGFFVNLYFFTFLPNDKIKIKSQLPGAMLVSVGWYVFSFVFGIYIKYYDAYSMYGSLSVVIIVLFWLYACMYILFMGGQFNYYLSLREQK